MQAKRTKVAFITFAPFISGSERCLQLILTQCESINIEPLLILPKASPLTTWADQHRIKYVGVAIDNINTKNLVQRLLLHMRLFATLLVNRIDVVHSNQIWSLKPIASVARLLNIPTVCHFRDPIDNGSKWWLGKGCDTAIFISQYITHQFFDTFNANLTQEHLTILDPIAAPPEPNGETLQQLKMLNRTKFEIPASAFVFGFFGQIAPVKGIVELIEALHLIKNENWALLIAGKAPEQHEDYYIKCQQLVDTYGLNKKIKFLGFVDKVTDIYATIDMAVIPSLEEPLGLIPLEAGIHGVPSIVSRVGGLPETVVENETGFVADVHDREGFAQILSTAINQPSDGMGKCAQSYVSRCCSVPNYMKELHELFIRTIERKSKPQPSKS